MFVAGPSVETMTTFSHPSSLPQSSRRLALFCLAVATATTTLAKTVAAFNAHVPRIDMLSPSTVKASAAAAAAAAAPLSLLPQQAMSRPRHVRIFAASSPYEEALEHNKKRTDVRRLLTQRALQSFIYLLLECRDPHTVRWLEVRGVSRVTYCILVQQHVYLPI
jgi:hypothetical protein